MVGIVVVVGMKSSGKDSSIRIRISRNGSGSRDKEE